MYQAEPKLFNSKKIFIHPFFSDSQFSVFRLNTEKKYVNFRNLKETHVVAKVYVNKICVYYINKRHF